MSSRRTGDKAASVILAPMDASRNSRVLAGETIGGRPVINTQGFRAAQINLMVANVASGGGGETLDCTIQESDPPALLPTNNPYDGTDDGSEKLFDGAASNMLFAIPFTPTVAGNYTMYSVALRLSRLGIPALAGGGDPSVYISIQTDAAGDPSGTKVGGDSRHIKCTNIGTGIEEHSFFFDVGVDLTNTTKYWIVIHPNYDTSAVKCIQVHYNTAVSTCKFYDAAWAVMTNQDVWYKPNYLIFANTAYVHEQITEPSSTWILPADEGGYVDRIEIDLTPRKSVLRAKYVGVGAAIWTIGHALTLSEPKALPVTVT